MTKTSRAVAFFSITGLALGLRLFLLLTNMNPLEADQATLGIMAIHILRGARPLLFYGQPYYGPLDAYLTAPLIAVFGADRMVIRIVPVLFSLVFVWVTYLVGKRFYSESVGWYSALYAACAPFILLHRGVTADADYIMVLVVGSLSLLLFHSWQENSSRSKALGLILLLLFGFWLHPVMVYYMLSMGVMWFAGRLVSIRSKKDEITVRGNARPLWAATGVTLWSVGYYLSYFVTLTMPILLGFLIPPPFSDLNPSSQLLLQGPFWNSIAICLSGAIVLGIGWTAIRLIQQGKSILPVFAFATLMLFVTFSIMIRMKEEALTIPRYLSPLYSAIPLGICSLFERTGQRVWLRRALFGTLLVVNLYGNLNVKPLPAPYELLALLEERGGVQYVYTDYWTGYWLAFESEEQVIPAVFDDHNQLGLNRYKPYVKEVDQAPNPLYIYKSNQENENEFRQYLEAEKITYQLETIDSYSVYHELSRPVRYPLSQP